MAPLTIDVASEADAPAVARVRTAASDHLVRLYGPGLWGYAASERGVRAGMRAGRVLVARDGGAVVGTLRLQRKKPWAIRAELFTKVARPIHLVDMAVEPAHQRRGLGRALLEAALEHAAGWPADAIRLDAWDAPAGAGGFYARCGYREVGRDSYRGAALVYFERLVPRTGPAGPNARL